MKRFLVVNNSTEEQTEMTLKSMCKFFKKELMDDFSVEVIRLWAEDAVFGDYMRTDPFAPYYIMCLS